MGERTRRSGRHRRGPIPPRNERLQSIPPLPHPAPRARDHAGAELGAGRARNRHGHRARWPGFHARGAARSAGALGSGDPERGRSSRRSKTRLCGAEPRAGAQRRGRRGDPRSAEGAAQRRSSTAPVDPPPAAGREVPAPTRAAQPRPGAGGPRRTSALRRLNPSLSQQGSRALARVPCVGRGTVGAPIHPEHEPSSRALARVLGDDRGTPRRPGSSIPHTKNRVKGDPQAERPRPQNLRMNAAT